MKYQQLKDLQISRIGLGSVQFGVDYGINNATGQVKYNEILEILSLASEKGINFIDTSRYYGSSEETLGRALDELGLADSFTVCTKLDLPKDYKDFSEEVLLQAVSDSMEQSREALRLEKLPVYLLHTGDYMKVKGGVIWDYLKEKKNEGILGSLGVSISSGPGEANEVLEDPAVEAIQIPYNIFDQRWHREKILEKAANKGVAVFNRSTYLQGLLVMESSQAATRLPLAVSYLETLEKFITDNNYDRKKMIVKFVFSEASISSTIVGVDSLEQLKENLLIYDEGMFDEKTSKILGELFLDVPDSVVNPSLWK
ncbi:MAG: aldo/keto reductase [Spirochaetaceae bacterium]|nr:aldo/keto reductase [Spirochaetaceae bacterium]